MKLPLHIAKEERGLLLYVLVVSVWVNFLVVNRYFDRFHQLTDNYWDLFIDRFHISGFDPITYVVLSQWMPAYNVFRHPLLAFFMYLPNQLNQGLMLATGYNWAQFIVAAMLTMVSMCSALLLYRLLHKRIGIQMVDAKLLTFFFFSFAYVLLAICVPDHFALSMYLLLLTLYIASGKAQTNTPMSALQTVVLFVLTAGVSLNNGIKVFMAALWCNGRHFFRLPYLLGAVIVPALLLWVAANLTDRKIAEPIRAAHRIRMEQHDSAQQAQLWQQTALKLKTTDSITIAKIVAQQDGTALQANQAKRQKQRYQHNLHKYGWLPFGLVRFADWIDLSTPRLPVLVEDFFGESLLLHEEHLLEDVLKGRPTIVYYRHSMPQIVNYLLIVLFLIGCWYGRQSRLLWLGLSFMAFDLLIHAGLGFGLNEVYIMSPHWLFVLPMAMAYLFKQAGNCSLWGLRLLFGTLTIYLLTHNLWLMQQALTTV